MATADPARPTDRTARSYVLLLAGCLLLVAVVGLAGWWLVRGSELATVRAHRGPVRAVAFSPDGTVYASAGDDETVRVWDAATNRERHALAGHGGKVRAIAFGAAPVLASAGDDHVVRLWDWQSGAALGTLAGPTKTLECLAVSPDGGTVAAAGVDGVVNLWKTADRRALKPLKGHTKHVHALAFTPDGKTLVSGGEDGSIRLWEWAAGIQTSLITLNRQHVQGFAVSPGGSVLTAAVSGAGVRQWNLPGRDECPAFTGAGMIRGVAAGLDGRVIATAHEDGTVKVWDAESARPLSTLTGHKKVVLAVAVAPVGKTLATGGGDGTVKRWAVPAK